ncbi:hypothetical protein RYH80_20085 [Halobaculum sp. MBLA0147]|uniref:hypothetical protein n=1 Tax=Halobaculum sp. MBLA0147 TaxID=3079934 RepID=UPI003526B821
MSEPLMTELEAYSEAVNEAPGPADYTVRTEYSWAEFCRRCDLHLQKEADSKAIDMPNHFAVTVIESTEELRSD